MPQQSFDHSEFIAGRLSEYQRIGWAEQVVLGQGPRSLWLMQAKHIKHTDGRRGFQLQIEKFGRKTNRTPFQKPETSFLMNEEVIGRLFQYLQRQQALGSVDLGSEYVAIPVDKGVAGLSSKHFQALATLLQGLCESDQFENMSADGALTTEVIRNIGAASQHLRYKAGISELTHLLGSQTDEHVYQKWFENHPWIFGTHYVGRFDLRRIGLHEISDLVMETTDGYLDLFELKGPNLDVLRLDKSRGNYFFTANVSAAIAQCANYISKTEENRHQLAQVEGALFLKPRARIVIGRSSGWDKQKRDALRMLNGSLHFIEVWTYDQLIAMAEQMVALYERPSLPVAAEQEEPTRNAEDDDVPF